MKLSSTLSWADRLIIIDRFELTQEEACTAFEVDSKELQVAKNLQTRGVFVPNVSLNTAVYEEFFSKFRSGELDTTQRVFKPKGSKPSKISMAFDAISGTPQKVSELIEKYDVSLAVLRQSKRFDKKNTGQIYIRKDKATGHQMIWRDSNVS